ncbi:unnamed protein product [Coregonus sp. 'balchen']|nr:unnamed protein product [Coregonus sp. 'balchen']
MAAAAPQAMILRFVDADHTRKINLSSRPASVDDLINILKAEFDDDFHLQTLSLETLRQERVQEVQKTERNLPLIDRKMQTTFALRRQGIVTDTPPVYAEFQRITKQNLLNIFYAEIDRHTPRLMTLYTQRASKTGRTADLH